jgi:hypothetical protein
MELAQWGPFYDPLPKKTITTQSRVLFMDEGELCLALEYG